MAHVPDELRYLGFDDYVLDRRARTLRRGRVRLPLQEKPLRVLEELLLAGNDVVTHDELAGALWPDREFVDRESGIHTAVRKLRDVLGDSAASPSYVETVPRVGYRFLRPVPTVPERDQATGSASDLAPESRPTRALVAGHRRPPVARTVLALTVLALVVAGSWLRLPRDMPGEEAAAGAAARRAPTAPSEARTSMQEGRYLLGQPMSPPAMAVARLRRATSQDPTLAAAHGLLAEALVREALDGTCAACTAEARAEAEMALELDPDQIDALLALSKLDLLFAWDARAAGRAVQRALDIAPDSAEGHLARAVWLAATGRPEEAVEAATRAADLDPAAFMVKVDLGNFLLAAGRNREAALTCLRMAEIEPTFTYADRCALLAFERLGEVGRASHHARGLLVADGAGAELLRRFDALEPDARLRFFWRHQLDRALETGMASPLRLASLFSMVGESDASLQQLEAAFDQRAAMLALLQLFPELDAVRDDPRFRELMVRIGVAA